MRGMGRLRTECTGTSVAESSQMTSRPIRVALVAAWLVAAGVGLAVMLNYQNAAGHAGETPAHWPAQAAMPLAIERATLLMFVHPRCPCSRASMEALNRLLTKCNGQVAAHVLFLQPAGLSDDWPQTGLWRSASAIPGVTVRADRDGAEAQRFGAETSGFVVLYSGRGELLFKGGITAARGHMGDSAGINLIASLSAGKSNRAGQTPVYGCSLLDGCGTSSGQTSQ